jgi:heat shock protein HtpX
VSDANLFAQQAANRRRSAILVTVFLLFFAWIGFGGDLVFHLATADAPPVAYHHTMPWLGLGATFLGAAIAWVGWKTGARQVLWATGAWQVLEPDTLEAKRLVNVVEEMAIASGTPVPKIWVVPDPDPNAFATGSDERHAHLAVTEGLLKLLDRDELQAVVAHEMGHIRNYDVKLMTLLAALVGVIALISDGARRWLWWGGGRSGRGGGGSGKKGGALLPVLLVVWLVTLVLAPVVSRVLALAVSRKREFLADATSAQFTRNPGALASALRRIEDAHAPTKSIHQGSAHLCIADPLGRRLTNREGFLANLLATHPPMAVRIARLKAMAYQYEKTGALPEGA